MPANDPSKLRFLLPGVAVSKTASRAHSPASRSAGAKADELLADLEVIKHIDLSAPSRAVGRQEILEPLEDDILALEMEDGFILYTSATRLADDLRRLDPAAERDGVLRLDTLKQRGPATRGLGDWIVRAVSVLRLGRDKIIDVAVEKAKEWVGDQAVNIVEECASWAGTKALMWAIEKQLTPGPGLYRWVAADGMPGDLQAALPSDFIKDWRPDDPILVFIHGTASSTLGSFGDFREPGSAREWQAMHAKYGKHIYAYEHRTFSESPIENVLGLIRALPTGARLSVVSHSRGGQVGDLMCLAGLGAERIARFVRKGEEFKEADEEDRRNLLTLDRLLAEKKFRVERYARVACPAQGTLLAGSNTDAFLSVLLHLIGLVPYLQISPTYAVVKRVVLQIAKNRTDPRLVPGIEAMLPGSPLTALLGQAAPKAGAEIAVIAGDIEGGGLLKRIGVFLTDHIIFENEDNDLVVDTDSMYGGLARESGRYLFDQGADVSHFRYFANNRTRRALQNWLTQEKSTELREFEPIKLVLPERKTRAAATGPRPVVIFLPGILSSHLKVGEKDRVWFDFFDIARGGLEKIQHDRPNISPDGLFDRYYGDLCDFLEDSHEVHRFAYDWRRPLRDAAARLAAEMERTLDATSLPVRLLTHSMGGLVVRALIARHRPVWDRLMQRQDAYWVMLGVPNRGSHLIVETLLGLGDSPRQLALVDTKHDLQWILDQMAAYPGMVQLLPRPGFRDTGDVGDDSPRFDYYTDATWRDFKKANDDFWFGKQLGGVPAVSLLADAKQSWQELKQNEQQQNEQLPNVERIAYVAGYGRATPCGIEKVKIGDREQVRMIGTLNGDGSVTHDSGLLDCLRQNGRIWYMDADHADLTNTPEKFPALLELLERGETTRLATTRPTVRGAEQTFGYEAGPVLYPTEQSLTRALLGGRRSPRRRGRAKYTLKVSCRGMDLRYACDPILVGHYQGDAISAAEAQIDRYLVEGGLTRRHRLGLYAGAPGTATIVLLKPTDQQARAGIQRGAIVIGLGELGGLTTAALGEAVRNGTLRYLMQLVDRQGGTCPADLATAEVGLATLLLGYNSTTHIGIEDSVSTIVRGVMVANRQFAEGMEVSLRVGRLEFIELYQDVAITAAHAVRVVGERLAKEAEVLGCRIEAAPRLECGESLCQRLTAISRGSYWSRLIVTDADRRDDLCPPECCEGRARKSRPEERASSEHLDKERRTETEESRLPTYLRQRPELARRLRFVFLSQRARAEAVEHQRQPGLVETLVERSIRDSVYQPDLSRTLFQLLVPHDFKEVARQAACLVLVVDGYTANLPWEMLVADEKPLVVNTALVRQLASTRFRLQVRGTLEKRAYVVGDPSTKGYYTAFPSPGMPGRDMLDPLPGAAQEARAVADFLAAQGYQVVEAPPGSEALDVINKLFKHPYRIVHISAHGVFQAGEGEAARSGVVLSDGLLLTAAEIGQMETVPDLVFLNCCFLGKTDNTPTAAYNRLAYSVARELIEIGVRAVVVAGWAVRDDAAKHFAEIFYQGFLQRQFHFGRAVHEARRQTYENGNFSNCNTWGAFQAYGDPSFAMDPGGGRERDGEDWNPVTPVELVNRVNQLKEELACAKEADRKLIREQSARQLKILLNNTPRDWLDLPGVLYALGRFHAESGALEPAVGYYEKAIAIEDLRGQVPVMAIEQLADLEARQGAKKKDARLVRRGIQRLLGLLDAADGTGEVRVNSERCALLGSAYKRLAKLLDGWSSDTGTENWPTGIKQALEQAVRWYEKGEGDPSQTRFNPYCAQNRLALQAILGNTRPEQAALALQAGDIARQRYVRSREYFDLVMAADGALIARLIDGGLRDRPEEAEREILGCYRDIREQLPESARQLDSVVTQIRLLAGFIEKRAAAEPEVEGLAKLGDRLSGIADLLEGKPDAAAGKQALAPTLSTQGSIAVKPEDTGSNADVSSVVSTAAEDSPDGPPPGSSAKARKKRPE